MIRLLLALTIAVVCTGCTSLITPPPIPTAKASTVYLIDYGYHTSLLLPQQSPRSFLEYAYGDWQWFALGKKGSGSGVRSMFFSSSAGLGRRTIHFDQSPTSQVVVEALQATRAVEFTIDADAVNRLARELDQQYTTGAARDSHYSPANQLTFVPSREHYWMFHNCNHETVEWLQALGCEVSGLHATSDLRVARAYKDRVSEAFGSPEAQQSRRQAPPVAPARAAPPATNALP
jgi:hypothetical protein